MIINTYFPSTCSYKRIQLGKVVKTNNMAVSITEPKLLKITDELSIWYKKRRNFTLLNDLTLCCNLEY